MGQLLLRNGSTHSELVCYLVAGSGEAGSLGMEEIQTIAAFAKQHMKMSHSNLVHSLLAVLPTSQQALWLNKLCCMIWWKEHVGSAGFIFDVCDGKSWIAEVADPVMNQEGKA